MSKLKEKFIKRTKKELEAKIGHYIACDLKHLCQETKSHNNEVKLNGPESSDSKILLEICKDLNEEINRMIKNYIVIIAIHN